MAPKTRAKSAKVGPKNSNPEQTINSKLHINTREDEGHYSAAVRSQDTETALQGTANAAANISAAPLDPTEPVDSGESPSPAVLKKSNGRRSRLHSGQPTEEDELEVADFLVSEDFRSRWASGAASGDVLVAAATTVEMTNFDLTRSPFIGMYCT